MNQNEFIQLQVLFYLRNQYLEMLDNLIHRFLQVLLPSHLIHKQVHIHEYQNLNILFNYKNVMVNHYHISLKPLVIDQDIHHLIHL